MPTANHPADPLRVQVEDKFAEALVSALPDSVRQRWQLSASVHRFLSHRNKRLVVFKKVEGKPVIHLTLSCVGSGLNFKEGLQTVWADTLKCKTFYIGHKPKELVDGCFMWHPSSSGIETRIVDNHLSVSVSTLVRQPSNPLRSKDHDGFSILEYRYFQEQFGG